ncbi:hypothetical protein LXL04_012007 [Taraxacum kok-saghyz]
MRMMMMVRSRIWNVAVTDRGSSFHPSPTLPVSVSSSLSTTSSNRLQLRCRRRTDPWSTGRTSSPTHFVFAGRITLSQQHFQGEDQTVDHESTITLWLNNKFLKNKKRTCDIKRMSRLKMQEPHVTGTKSFARLAEEEATKKDGVYPSRGEIFRIAHTRKDGSIVNENVATILAAYLFQQHGEKTDVPPSPIPTGNYNVSPEQLASMTRDHDMSALQNFDGVKGLSEMLKTNPDKGIDDDETNILDRKNRFLLDACRDTTLIILLVAAATSLALGIKIETSFCFLTCIILFHGIKEGWYDGGSIALAVIIVIVVTAISDYKQSLQFQNLNEEKQNIHLKEIPTSQGFPLTIEATNPELINTKDTAAVA